MLAGGVAVAGQGLEPPWDFGKAKTGESRSGSPASSGLLGLIRGWQEAVAPVDAIECPSQPSCSRYAAQALKEHGALLGTFMATDRLVHEASEWQRAPLIKTPRGYKIDDPVEANDFWHRWR